MRLPSRPCLPRSRSQNDFRHNLIRWAVAGTVAAAALAADTKTPSVARDSRLFEMRTYHPVPGKLQELHARFRDHISALLRKHGVTIVGFWVLRTRRRARTMPLPTSWRTRVVRPPKRRGWPSGPTRWSRITLRTSISAPTVAVTSGCMEGGQGTSISRRYRVPPRRKDNCFPVRVSNCLLTVGREFESRVRSFLVAFPTKDTNSAVSTCSARFFRVWKVTELSERGTTLHRDRLTTPRPDR